ncbi:hypothetical protein T4B_7665 [Trichinella pseudospiralis]|uniref:Uncharacterized protein n=1 Tax=Trichinella pseudospiralis TaxID=6337 RepID=A0A0V1EGK6_TRIPS|nr:hypothetical protein T4E_4362 [Trichinella pseudospiralis]KRY72762.1 hypothetical protein T4A_4354 [Trichinella pseudospiralis]KRZ23226.1 hypothetical protein T4B_7665 [Trichinella pseudospiralis]KRZ35501.1 hypothetical protein T4C_5203 [Trichinella pseudospiralis]
MAKSASTMVSDTSVICPLEFVQRRCWRFFCVVGKINWYCVSALFGNVHIRRAILYVLEFVQRLASILVQR